MPTPASGALGSVGTLQTPSLTKRSKLVLLPRRAAEDNVCEKAAHQNLVWSRDDDGRQRSAREALRDHQRRIMAELFVRNQYSEILCRDYRLNR